MIALPITVGPKGQLRRAESVDSVMALIGAMAGTTPGTWPHAPWFGLQPRFMDANMRLEQHSSLADAINTALVELDLTWVKVQAVRTAQPCPPGERRFDITLAVEGQGPVFRQLTTS